MAALGRFYRDVSWEGTIREGGMGPGTPAMTGVGRGTARAIQEGRWIVLDCEQDQFLLDGSFVLKWQLHWVSGWSPEHGEYQAVMTDNYGHAEVFHGRIDGDRLVFESIEEPRPGCGSPGTPATRPSSLGATRWRSVMGRGSSSRSTAWSRDNAAPPSRSLPIDRPSAAIMPAWTRGWCSRSATAAAPCAARCTRPTTVHGCGLLLA